jgi:hypothetical protein
MAEQLVSQQNVQQVQQALQQAGIPAELVGALSNDLLRVLVQVGKSSAVFALDSLAAGVTNVDFGPTSAIVKLVLPSLVVVLKEFVRNLPDPTPGTSPAPAQPAPPQPQPQPKPDVNVK